ncbi:MAG: AAA family ATPase [Solirubrobacteraceae bacterium]
MRLLERERECAAAQALIDAAATGGGGLLVVEGPSGIGKSVLLAEVVRRAGAAGVAARSVRATRPAAEAPFALARWLLDPLVRATPSALAAGWARHARPLFTGEVSGAGDRRVLVEGLVALVTELRLLAGALALIVDDAQWGDPASLEFLGVLSDRCEDVGVAAAIAIGTGQGEVDELSLRRLAATAGSRVLIPKPLSAGAVHELVLERLPAAEDGFAARVAEAAGGNPLLVAELIDSAAHHGTDALSVPEGVTRTVLLRVQDAGAAARALAEAVAVLGEAPLRLAAALAGLDGRTADRAADELIARQVLVAREPVRFLQPLVGDALSATIAPFELAARHRRAAELLGDDGADADRIAAHLLRTRPAGRPWVCETLRKAARTALGRGVPAVAARLLERALEEPPALADRGTVLLELASARGAAGRPEAILTFERALADEHEPARRGEAWLGLSRLLYARGEFTAAVTAGARGGAELPDGEPVAERLLAVELTAASSVPELAAEAMKRLDALVGTAPTEPALLAMLCTHQSARVIEVEQVPELARRAVAADPLISPEAHGIPLIYVAGALNFIDETVLAEELLDRGLERATELGDPLAEVNVRSVRAWCRIFRGRLALAGEDLDAMLAAGELGWPSIAALCAMPLIVLRLERGDLDGARDALLRAPAGAQVGQAWFTGAVALAENDAAAALTAFEAAGAELEDGLGVVNPGVLPWRSSAAAAARLGDLPRARSLAAIEVEHARRARGPRALGIALRIAGLVDDDPALLQESVTVLEGSPARLELSRSLAFLGAAQRRAGRTPAARATLSRALELAHECDAPPLVERTLAELRSAGARPRRRPRSGVRALTASERRTAEMAAAGRTTRQVAATLFLSPKTVEGHLTSVFRKLAISSRAELGPRLAAGEDDRSIVPS